MSKNSSEVSWAISPIFSSLRPLLKPGVPSSTTISDTPLAPSSGAVLATTMTISELMPLVMNVLLPLMT
ncbi:hypothetical protein D3C79_1081160 [compost metagenome]